MVFIYVIWRAFTHQWLNVVLSFVQNIPKRFTEYLNQVEEKKKNHMKSRGVRTEVKVDLHLFCHNTWKIWMYQRLEVIQITEVYWAVKKFSIYICQFNVSQRTYLNTEGAIWLSLR